MRTRRLSQWVRLARSRPLVKRSCYTRSERRRARVCFLWRSTTGCLWDWRGWCCDADDLMDSYANLDVVWLEQ